LGLIPKVQFSDGVRDLVAWSRTEGASARPDHVQSALGELQSRGLIR
jgi:hypothetical protein